MTALSPQVSLIRMHTHILLKRETSADIGSISFKFLPRCRLFLAAIQARGVDSSRHGFRDSRVGHASACRRDAQQATATTAIWLDGRPVLSALVFAATAEPLIPQLDLAVRGFGSLILSTILLCMLMAMWNERRGRIAPYRDEPVHEALSW